MRIKRRQLKILIEQFLLEQEEEAQSDVPAEDAPEEAAEPETPEEEEEPAEEEVKLENIPEFKIEIDDSQHRIKFFKDNNQLQYKVDGEIISNKSLQDFVTLAGLGLINAEEEDVPKLLKIVKLDKSLAKYSDVRIKDMIKQKIETDRIGFTDSDIRKSLGKM